MTQAETRVYWPVSYRSKPSGWIIGWNKRGLTVVVASIIQQEWSVLEKWIDSSSLGTCCPEGLKILGEWHQDEMPHESPFSSVETRAYIRGKRQTADLWLVLQSNALCSSSFGGEPNGAHRSSLHYMCPILRDVFCCGCRYLSTLQLIFYDPSAFYRISSPLFSLSLVLENEEFLRLHSRCPPPPEEEGGAHDAVEVLPVASTSSSSGPSKAPAKGAVPRSSRPLLLPTAASAEAAEPLAFSPFPSLDYPSSPLSSSTSTRQIVSASSSSKESASDTETGSSCQPQSIPSDSEEDFVVPKRRVGPRERWDTADPPKRSTHSADARLTAEGAKPNILVTDSSAHTLLGKQQSGLSGSKIPLVSLHIQHSRTSSSNTTASSLGGPPSHRHSTSGTYKNRSELAETVEMLNWAKPLDHLLTCHFGENGSTCIATPWPGYHLWARRLAFRATLGWLTGLHVAASSGLAFLRLLQRPFDVSANVCATSYTARQLETKGHEFGGAHRIFELLFEPRGTRLGQPCEESCHPGAAQHVTLSYYDWFARQVLDNALGCACAFFAWTFAHDLYRHLRPPVQYVTQDMPEAYLDWFLGWPAGFKANDQLNPILGYSSLALMVAWRGLMLHVHPWWPSIIRVVGLSGLLGLTTLISVIADLVVVGSIHLHFLYWCFAKVCMVQVCILDSLGMLFRGKKFNPLRKRVDSAEFGLEQLLLGTVWFTLLIFIFPTVAVYYLFFTAMKLLLLGVQEALNLTVITLNVLPTFLLAAFVLQTFQKHPIPDGVFFEFMSLRRSDPAPLAPTARLRGLWGRVAAAGRGAWRRWGRTSAPARASAAVPKPTTPSPPGAGSGKLAHHAQSRSYCLGSFRPTEAEVSLAFDQSNDLSLRQPLYCFAFHSQPLRVKVVFHEYIAALRTLWKQRVFDLPLLRSFASGAHARLSPFPTLDQSARLGMKVTPPDPAQPPASTASLSSKGPLERPAGRAWPAGGAADPGPAPRRRPRRPGKGSSQRDA